MSMTVLLLAAMGVGFLSGLRAFTPIALICWLAVWGWIPLAGSPLSFLGTMTGAIIASTLALAELIGDKLPQMQARLAPGPLGARVITGALSGMAICLAGGQTWMVGVLAGALGAVSGSFAGYHTRRALVRATGLPDFIFAIAEDFFTVGGTLFLLSRLFGKSV